MIKKSGRKGLSDLPSQQRNIMSIGEYLDKMEDYKSYPGRIKNGGMWVMVQGHWITKKEFDEIIPIPFVADFKSNLNNCDTTRLWQHQ